MRAARRAARDRHELHRFHSKRVIDVRAAPPVGGPPFGVNLSGRAPSIGPPTPIEDHLDIVLAGEP
jgi:hypothetical protein